MDREDSVIGSAASPEAVRSVDFYFDIICPWAFQTSLWIREVSKRFDFSINWKFFSLEETNLQMGKKHPWEREWSYGWSMLRICAYLRRESPAKMDSFYLKAGTALHLEGRKAHTIEVSKDLIEELGWNRSIVDAALSDPTTHDDIKFDHDHIVSRGGFGVPTLVVRDQPIFGPVITPAPTGEQGVDLWRLVELWSRFDHLYEMRRPKTATDLDHIADSFAPYLQSRDWKTVQTEAP